MAEFEIVALYVGLFVLLFLGMKLNAGRVRASVRVSIGDGGDARLQKAIRIQANAAEDVPVVLIGLLALATLNAPTILLHGLGASFFLFRLAHAVTMAGNSGSGLGRMIGTLGTVLVMLVTAGACVYLAVV